MKSFFCDLFDTEPNRKKEMKDIKPGNAFHANPMHNIIYYRKLLTGPKQSKDLSMHAQMPVLQVSLATVDVSVMSSQVGITYA